MTRNTTNTEEAEAKTAIWLQSGGLRILLRAISSVLLITLSIFTAHSRRSAFTGRAFFVYLHWTPHLEGNGVCLSNWRLGGVSPIYCCDTVGINKPLATFNKIFYLGLPLDIHIHWSSILGVQRRGGHNTTSQRKNPCTKWSISVNPITINSRRR